MRVDVLGAVSVTNDARTISGLALGGRRARIALVALALSPHPIPAERLATVIWGDDRPATWNAALRGVIRSLRTALAPIGLDEQRLITTEPAGYRLHPAADVDVIQAREHLRAAQSQLAEGLNGPAVKSAEGAQSTADLLPGEDAPWLDEQREELENTGRRALELITQAAGATGDHAKAERAARALVVMNPLDERAHRTLISTLHKAGDRAAVVVAYEQCRAVLAEELGIDPSAETVDLYLSALRSDPLTKTARPPIKTSAFVGRQREIDEIGRAIANTGAVTLTGRGGVGKSRLALEVARGDVVLWVDVNAVGEDELVAAHVALQLGASLGEGDPAITLVAKLAPLGAALLVLDGCEHVVNGVASLVSALVSGCPALTVLCTGRVALAIEGETVIPISPLRTTHTQIELLRARVIENGGELRLDESTKPILDALCQRCAGLPLALELAAASLSAMSPADLLESLGETDEPDQLRAVLAHSYALLEPDEAQVFRRCAVLGGQVSLPLIRAVVSGDGIAPVRVVRILRELSAWNLLTVDRSGPRWRYQQDDDLRRFAAELLDQHHESRATYVRLAEAISDLVPADAKSSPAPFAAAITENAVSLRSVLAAACEGRLDREIGLGIAFRLHRYWAATNVAEGRFWLSRLLEGTEPTRTTGLAAFALGYLAYWAGDLNSAVPLLEAAVGQLRGVEDGFCARALMYLGGLADDLDRGADAAAYVRESTELAERVDDPNLFVGATMGTASVLGERADPEAAAYARTALDLCRANANQEQLAMALPTATMICWQVGALAEARAFATEARPMHVGGKRIARTVLMSASAGIALADGDLDAALEFARTADREATELGVERELPLIRCLLSRALLAAGLISEAADRAVAAIEAAQELTYDWPLAQCLETAALILGANGGVGPLLVAAAGIRRQGDRPGPPSLMMDIIELRAQLSDVLASAVRMTPTEAAGAAVARLRLVAALPA